MSALNNPIFQDANTAREWLEAHLWADGRACGYCGTVNNSTPIKTRPGYYQCNAKECRKQFTVMVGTVFERSHIPLNKWLMASFLICASKKGMSAHQLHRMLGVSYKSTWFMMHRIREAMAGGSFPAGPIGGENKVVEADESFIGGKAKNRAFREPAPKKAVFSLVEREGQVRTFHVASVNSKTLGPIIEQQVHKATMMMTDDSPIYPGITKRLEMTHGSVNHSANEYVRAYFWHTNTVENYFSILKRGITGVYHHVSEAHLHRYTAEFDFRYSNRSGLGIGDEERAGKLLKGIVGKRLTYRRPNQNQAI
ncbi:MAG: IS1595 family transposase [Rhodomicrobium sp.]